MLHSSEDANRRLKTSHISRREVGTKPMKDSIDKNYGGIIRPISEEAQMRQQLYRKKLATPQTMENYIKTREDQLLQSIQEKQLENLYT